MASIQCSHSMHCRNYELMYLFAIVFECVLSVQLSVFYDKVMVYTHDLRYSVFVGSFLQSLS